MCAKCRPFCSGLNVLNNLIFPQIFGTKGLDPDVSAIPFSWFISPIVRFNYFCLGTSDTDIDDKQWWHFSRRLPHLVTLTINNGDISLNVYRTW